MEAIETLKKLAGRVLSPIRAGADKNAAHAIGARPSLAVRSASFADGAPIPAVHAGDHGTAPSLAWGDVPPGTKEVVVICEDPDAPMPKPFVHWIVLHVAPTTTELREPLVQGENSAGRVGWTGPKPPKGHGVHHYHFQVFALDAPLACSEGAKRDEVVGAMRDRVIAMGEVVGTYENA